MLLLSHTHARPLTLVQLHVWTHKLMSLNFYIVLTLLLQWYNMHVYEMHWKVCHGVYVTPANCNKNAICPQRHEAVRQWQPKHTQMRTSAILHAFAIFTVFGSFLYFLAVMFFQSWFGATKTHWYFDCFLMLISAFLEFFWNYKWHF